jgi:hypothetical protein
LYLASTTDADGNKQWYSVSTYHASGSNFYASSSDSTGIYKQERDANNVFTDVTMPTSQTMTETATDGTETTKSAEEYWLANSWEK